MGSLVWALAWAPDGSRFALGGSDKRVHLFDARSGEEVDTLSGHTDDLTFCCFSHCGTRLVTAADGLKVKGHTEGDDLMLWSTPPDGRASLERRLANTLEDSCVGLEWAPDGDRIGAAGGDGTLVVIGCSSSGSASAAWLVTAQWQFDQKAEGGKLRGASWSKDSAWLAAGLGEVVVIVAAASDRLLHEGLPYKGLPSKKFPIRNSLLELPY